jgi:hypothetical protein
MYAIPFILDGFRDDGKTYYALLYLNREKNTQVGQAGRLELGSEPRVNELILIFLSSIPIHAHCSQFGKVPLTQVLRVLNVVIV